MESESKLTLFVIYMVTGLFAAILGITWAGFNGGWFVAACATIFFMISLGCNTALVFEAIRRETPVKKD